MFHNDVTLHKSIDCFYLFREQMTKENVDYENKSDHLQKH